ncbi:unnamed protein product [Hymenolepis diminuta]|uniref:Uncharacterized protein n=1 Tax=Hymenolepis diminuta TaxID=6216 RepID=A0A564ZDD5_HYMDI|nr:unnamed protein product [Hymenolepis diminuta]
MIINCVASEQLRLLQFVIGSVYMMVKYQITVPPCAVLRRMKLSSLQVDLSSKTYG